MLVFDYKRVFKIRILGEDMKKLNLGCGNDIKNGYVNLDISKLPGVDVVWDINKLPLAFKKEEFDEIYCKDVLEHVVYIPLLRELHRILKKGGRIKIRVPHFTSKNLYSDPTHKSGFSSETFTFFLKEHPRSYYFDFHFSKIKVYLEFDKKYYLFWNYLLELIFNINWRLQIFYELTPLRIFPANCLWITLTK